MEGERGRGKVLRFGVFEVDLRAAELRKQGIRIKLQEQPFQILSLLMERQGELVTREELRHRLWPDHTFVDFDRSLNKAMTKLRSALADSAENPRYIETLYRRGYRLLVPVTTESTQLVHPAPILPSPIVTEPLPVLLAPRPGLLLPNRARMRIAKLAAVSFVVLVALFSYGRVYHSLAIGRFSTGNSPKRSIAVLGFKNLSRDPNQAWLSTALCEWLTTELSAGEQLRTIAADNVARMKVELSLPDVDAFLPTNLDRIRKDLGTDLVVVGSYATLDSKNGDQIRLDMRLQDTQTGETLQAISETGTVSHLFELVAKAGQSLRSKLGVPAVTLEQQQAVAIELPSNPEAARRYSEGLAKLRDFDSLAARDLFEQAIAVEPDFALSHAALATAWRRLGYDEAAKDEGKKAFELSSKLSRSSRLLVEARYREASREWERAIEIYRALFEFFPDDLDYGLALADAQVSGEKGVDALATVEMLRQLPAPLRDDPRIDLEDSNAAESQGDYRRSQQSAARAAEKARASGTSLLLAKALLSQAWASENLGDFDKVTPLISESKAVASTAHDQGLVAATLTIEAISLQMMGDFPAARERYAQALALDRKIGNMKGVAAGFDNMGDALFSLGELPSARQSYQNAVATYKQIAHQDGVGLADVGLGDVLLTMGKPNEATSHYQEALDICRQLGDRSKAAGALLGLGRAQYLQGQLETAARTELEARTAYQQIGDTLSTARAELVLARLNLANHELEQAARSAASAAEAFERMHSAADAGGAYVLLSESLLEQNKLQEAEAKIALAVKLAQSSHQRELNLLAEVGAARVHASSRKHSDIAEAAQRLTQVLHSANRAGFAVVALEARLALGEIEFAEYDHSSGVANLEAVQKTASQAGMALLANRAAAKLRATSMAAAL